MDWRRTMRACGLVLLGLLGGCATVKPPILALDGLKVGDMGVTGVAMDVGFRLRNPNPEALRIDRFEYELFVNGRRLGRGFESKGLELPGFGEGKVRSRFDVNLLSLPAAGRALALARDRKQRGEEAAALRLLGEIATRGTPPDRETAERHYATALEVAEELRIRPLQARSHLGLARHHARLGHRATAEQHLVRALMLFSGMDMRFWVKQAVQTLPALGRLLIVSREHAAIFAYLERLLAPGDPVTVLLDRRSGEPAPPRSSDRRADAQGQARLQSLGMIVVAAGD